MVLELLPDAPSLLLPGHRRKSCRVLYDLPLAEPETVWFEVPQELAGRNEACANAWLVCFLPLAASLKERLIIRAAVDPLLQQNAEELLRVWSKWHPAIQPIEIEAPTQRSEFRERPADSESQRQDSQRWAAASALRAGCFFSGGVDSFFTVLHQGGQVERHRQAGERVIEDLVYVWGFDLPLARQEEFAKLRASLTRAAEGLGKCLHVVATNLREGQYRRLAWGRLSHGCALGTVAHLLAGAFSKFLLSSTHTYKESFPWGSHPLTDPLMSSANLAIRHYGSGFDRLEKLEFIADNAIAMERLHVCYWARTAANCGKCAKCYRTMLALDILGRLRESTAFPTQAFEVGKARRLLADDENSQTFHRLIAAHAIARNRMDVAQALQDCERWNHRRRFFSALTHRFQGIRVAQRPLAALNRRIQRGAIE
jgi:hypothetical protein